MLGGRLQCRRFLPQLVPLKYIFKLQWKKKEEKEEKQEAEEEGEKNVFMMEMKVKNA